MLNSLLCVDRQNHLDIRSDREFCCLVLKPPILVPERGRGRDTRRDCEPWILRRYLVEKYVMGELCFPLRVSRPQADRPDYVVEFVGIGNAARWYIEITELIPTQFAHECAKHTSSFMNESPFGWERDQRSGEVIESRRRRSGWTGAEKVVQLAMGVQCALQRKFDIFRECCKATLRDQFIVLVYKNFLDVSYDKDDLRLLGIKISDECFSARLADPSHQVDRIVLLAECWLLEVTPEGHRALATDRHPAVHSDWRHARGMRRRLARLLRTLEANDRAAP